MSEGEYGITNTGFKPKPIDVLEDDAKELLKSFFGDNVDLTQQSPLWRLTQVPVVEISQLWLTAEQNFYSNYIQTAEGIALELLANDMGLVRKPAVSAVVLLKIYKNTSDAVTVPEGSLFQTNDNIFFTTNSEITIASGDQATTTGTVYATAVDAGVNGNVASNTIIMATNVIAGVDSCINESAATGGEDTETDEDLRKRLDDYVTATWTAEAIQSAALNVDGVAAVKVIESANSYTCMIVPQTLYDSALETLISAAIEKVTPITVEYTLVEADVVAIDVSATVVLTSLLDSTTAESLSETKIGEYIAELSIDDDVIKSKIIQAIMNVSGITNVYNLTLKGIPTNEKHTYTTGTSTYNLDYSTGNDIDTVKGLLSGVEHTFVENTDYSFSTSPARITWLSGDKPDNDSVMRITYEFPANAIGDVEINQETVAKVGDITFST